MLLGVPSPRRARLGIGIAFGCLTAPSYITPATHCLPIPSECEKCRLVGCSWFENHGLRRRRAEDSPPYHALGVRMPIVGSLISRWIENGSVFHPDHVTETAASFRWWVIKERYTQRSAEGPGWSHSARASPKLMPWRRGIVPIPQRSAFIHHSPPTSTRDEIGPVFN